VDTLSLLISSLIIKTAWSNVWSQAFCKMFVPCPSLPKVDFTQQTVLAAFLGQRSNGCCQMAFTSVESTDWG